MLLGSAYNWLRRSARHRRRTNLIAARRHKHASETTIPTIDIRSNRVPRIKIFLRKKVAMGYDVVTWWISCWSTYSVFVSLSAMIPCSTLSAGGSSGVVAAGSRRCTPATGL